MNSEDIKAFTKSLGLVHTGITSAIIPKPPYHEHICPLASGQGDDRYQPEALLTGCQSIIVILFPYYDNLPAQYNISLYAQAEDYHIVVNDYLHQIVTFLEEKEPTSRHVCCVDTSPLADRWLAYQAGLGFIGENGCFINPACGSYCYIGSILSTIPLCADQPMSDECQHCGACKACCPGDCLSDSHFHYEHCKSYLTQKKGDLTAVEQGIIKKTPLIYGCDECQKICPHNRHLPVTPIPAFRKNKIIWLHRQDIQNLSNRQFKAIYGNRAFAWRGKKILLRNMNYTEQ